MMKAVKITLFYHISGSASSNALFEGVMMACLLRQEFKCCCAASAITTYIKTKLHLCLPPQYHARAMYAGLLLITFLTEENVLTTEIV